MRQPARRLVTDLLRLLPNLGRAMEAQCDLHLSQMSLAELPPEVKAAFRDHAKPTQTQMELAIELVQEGPATVRDLAQRLGVTAAAISLLVDRMEEHGWVERQRDSEDRRVVWVSLTALAHQIADLMLCVQRSQLTDFLRDVPEQEREPFVRNLRRFAGVLEHVRASDAPARGGETVETRR